jgi:hypothetical protein
MQEHLDSVKLLIVDEFGYVSFTAIGSGLLFEVLSLRYERGATLVTSDLHFDEWTSVFGSERLTGALSPAGDPHPQRNASSRPPLIGNQSTKSERFHTGWTRSFLVRSLRRTIQTWISRPIDFIQGPTHLIDAADRDRRKLANFAPGSLYSERCRTTAFPATLLLKDARRC